MQFFHRSFKNLEKWKILLLGKLKILAGFIKTEFLIYVYVSRGGRILRFLKWITVSPMLPLPNNTDRLNFYCSKKKEQKRKRNVCKGGGFMFYQLWWLAIMVAIHTLFTHCFKKKKQSLHFTNTKPMSYRQEHENIYLNRDIYVRATDESTFFLFTFIAIFLGHFQ